ncbi:RNA methyltransferase [Aureococcus anophagefferens]|nr:RNA methyltransferase [Aureococcus anophagefferens]
MRCAWAFVGRRQIAATPRRSLRSQATGDDWFSPAQRAALPTVDASQWARLEAAARHLFDWNAKVNVVSRKDLDRRKLVELHYLPSLALLNVRASASPRRRRVVDVGTGGGFPGLPLAICRPELDFTLCDSRRKKVDVVASCADVAGCGNVAPGRGRAQDIAGDHDPCSAGP